MRFKQLANTDVILPEIGFGTWKFSETTEVIETAIANGTNFIDTAEAYGTE